MMFLIKLISVLFQLLNLIYAGHVQDKLVNSKTIKITNFKGYCRGKDVPLQSFYNGITSDNWCLYFANISQVVKEDLPDNLKLNIMVHRCRSRENLDTCEEFHTYKNLDFCQSINPDSFILNQSPFAIIYQPKYKCPIKKGTYVAHNASISLAPFAFMASGDWSYWRVISNLFPSNGSRLLQCTEVEAYVITKRQ